MATPQAVEIDRSHRARGFLDRRDLNCCLQDESHGDLPPEALAFAASTTAREWVASVEKRIDGCQSTDRVGRIYR